MTNREKFNKHVRAKVNEKLKAYENLTNESLIEHLGVDMRINLERELVSCYLDWEHEISVHSKEHIIEWLGKEAR